MKTIRGDYRGVKESKANTQAKYFSKLKVISIF
jgi:hypothetical protein